MENILYAVLLKGNDDENLLKAEEELKKELDYKSIALEDESILQKEEWTAETPPQTHFCLSLCLQPARYCNGSIQHTVCSAALRNSLLLSPFMLLKRGGDNTRVTHLPKTRELILYRLLNNACSQQKLLLQRCLHLAER